MNTITYRQGGIADLDAIRPLTLLAYGQFKNVLSEENVRQWELTLGNNDTYLHLFEVATCFVAESEGRVVGSAYLVSHGVPFKWFRAEWSYIRLVAVHPDWEGKGIGRQLTQMCTDHARETGESVIALHTSEFQHAARHIYESMGFVKQEEFKLYDKKYWLYLLQLNKG